MWRRVIWGKRSSFFITKFLLISSRRESNDCGSRFLRNVSTYVPIIRRHLSEVFKLHNHCRENPILHILSTKLVLVAVWILRKRIFLGPKRHYVISLAIKVLLNKLNIYVYMCVCVYFENILLISLFIEPLATFQAWKLSKLPFEIYFPSYRKHTTPELERSLG